MSENGVNRRLSAILSADVVGYSRLIATDEQTTLKATLIMFYGPLCLEIWFYDQSAQQRFLAQTDVLLRRSKLAAIWELSGHFGKEAPTTLLNHCRSGDRGACAAAPCLLRIIAS